MSKSGISENKIVGYGIGSGAVQEKRFHVSPKSRIYQIKLLAGIAVMQVTVVRAGRTIIGRVLAIGHPAKPVNREG